jgi:hypothetical protein
VVVFAALAAVPVGAGLSAQHKHRRQRSEIVDELRNEADALRSRIERRTSRFHGEPRELAGLADAMCRCTDQRCVEAVTEQVTDWSRDVEPSAIWIQPDAAAQIRAQTERMSACLTRVVTGTRQRGDAGRLSQSTEMVELPLDGSGVAPLHDAAYAIALSCNVSVVVPGTIAPSLTDAPREIRCEHAFDSLDGLLRATDVGSEVDDTGIVRLGRRGDLVLERAARRDRQRRGIARDALPIGSEAQLYFRQQPVRSVLTALARSADLVPVFADGVDGSVTARVSNVPWDRALIAILDATGLDYRYDAQAHQLRIAPRDQLGAERTTRPTHGEPAERTPSADPKQ